MGKITKALQKAAQERLEHLDKAVKLKEYEQVIVRKLKESSIDPRIISYYDNKSMIAEQYKILTTNLLSLNKGKPPKTIAVTSSVAGEGKTLTSLNLAITMSQATRKPRIILIDADMRRGQVLKYLGVKEHHLGLSEYLNGQANLNDIVFHLDIDHLSFISSGAVPSNPAELIGSQRMKDLIALLRGQYDMVIIDTPPVIPVTDAVMVGTMVEGVLMVIQAGKTQRGMVARSTELLEQAHAQIVGHVLTSIEYFVPEYIYRYL